MQTLAGAQHKHEHDTRVLSAKAALQPLQHIREQSAQPRRQLPDLGAQRLEDAVRPQLLTRHRQVEGVDGVPLARDQLHLIVEGRLVETLAVAGQ